ncbi:2-dehydropantoate 2-reductase [Conexibacter arvalis]|uniref:2-dehydropantoate 2-reductase n=1 Tax=Conexibacter arvalis TaxID=912552 RepID=A0A840I9G1_9ACTN|nr:2-dehydropantoate 2-reductase [Conexibacter arvalis]MBB4660570.1 2-dehydropantoate 2-reductase [Conexibacter arvalis]
MNVAVVGMGAVGTAIAGALARAGHAVLACGRSFSGRAALTVSADDGEFTALCDWLRDPAEVVAPVDWVVVATKWHQTRGAEEWLMRLCGAGTAVIVARNGVDHVDQLAGRAGELVVPALVYLNIDHLGRGRVRVRRTGADLVVPDDAGGRRVHDLLAPGGLVVERTADFTTAAWTKLLTNVSANPITALTGRGCEVLREPRVADLAGELIAEAVEVGRAEGAVFDARAVDDAVAWMQSLPDGAKTSMLQDRELGRPLEWEGLTGAVVRAADRHGLAVPVNRAVMSLLSACGA